MKAYCSTTTTLPPAERERLIAENMELAKRTATRLAARTPHAHTPDELISVALMGLVEAANRYDTTREEPFETFARKRIRGAVFDELRRQDTLPRRVRQLIKRAGEVNRRIELLEGRRAEDREVADELGVAEQDLTDGYVLASRTSFVELLDDTSAETGTASSPSPFDEASRRELQMRVATGLRNLPQRDARILALYYIEELTFAEIGSLLGVSAPRVCQLHGRALSRLRTELEASAENKPIARERRTG